MIELERFVKVQGRREFRIEIHAERKTHVFKPEKFM